MAQLTVRRLKDDVVHQLKVRAAHNKRSAEAEHRAILEAVLRPDATDFWDRAAELRAATRGRKASDSATILREDRDRDHRARR